MRLGRGFVIFFLLWLAVSLPAVLWPRGLEIWGGLTLAWVTLSLWDLKAIHRLPCVAVERQIPRSLPLGIWRGATIRLTNPGKASITFDVFGGYPKDMNIVGLPQRVTLPGTSWVEIHHALQPTKRGKLHLEAIGLSLHSPLRFWRRTMSAGESSNVRVYPDFSVWKRFPLPRERFRRGYQQNSQIDPLWSDGSLGDTGLQVFFLLDCGPRMLATEGGDLSHFDHCLNAMLLIGRIALLQGASVGLLTFTHYLPPQKGRRALITLLDTLHNLQADTHDTDYLTAATEILNRLKKHTLVIVIGMLGQADENNVQQALRLLRQRHRVLLVNLGEDDGPPRRMLYRLSRRTGVRGLNTSPKCLSNVLARRYPEII